jgi:hypothetical protein
MHEEVAVYTPSEPTRTRSSIQLDMPHGWFFKESYTLIAPDGRANVIASSEPVEPSMTTEEYASVQGEILDREFEGYEQHGDLEAFAVSGVEGYAILREFSWTPEVGEPVTQLQLYAVRRGRGFTATATTPTSDVERFRSALYDVLGSLVVVPEAADSMAAVEHWESQK